MSGKKVQEFNVEFTKIAEGLSGAEGPVFNKDGEFIMVAPAIPDENGKSVGRILKVNLNNGETSVWCQPKFDDISGFPTGCQCDRDNNIWVADMMHGILKVTPDGRANQITRQCDGQLMQGCNDCAFDSKGNLYVSAPAGPIAPEPHAMSYTEPFGSLYCLRNDGVISKLDTGFLFSNGLAVSSDDKVLIVAETMTKKLWAYDIVGNGKVNNKHLWATLPDHGYNGPDGMDYDVEGNLLVANWGASHIEVFNNNGEHIYRIRCPFTQPSNMHFQPNSNRIYVTEHQYNGLWYFDWLHQGQKQYCDLE